MAALEEIDAFGVLLGGCFHRSDNGELVGDGSALGEEFGKVGAGNVSRDAFEWAAGTHAGFGVPGFELAGTTAEPEEDAVFLFPLCDLSEGWCAEESAPAHAGDGTGGESLEELATVEVVVGRATVWRRSGHGERFQILNKSEGKGV